jgi:hypothetical protein
VDLDIFTHMMTKLFNPDARLGHWLALSISVTALAGCGGKVVEVPENQLIDSGKSDSHSSASDSATASDSFEPADTSEPIDTFTPPPDPTDGSTSSKACADCVAAKCPSERAACAASTACVAVLKCVSDCGSDSSCANACVNDETKPGVALAIDLITCAQDRCPSECGL